MGFTASFAGGAYVCGGENRLVHAHLIHRFLTIIMMLRPYTTYFLYFTREKIRRHDEADGAYQPAHFLRRHTLRAVRAEITAQHAAQYHHRRQRPEHLAGEDKH